MLCQFLLCTGSHPCAYKDLMLLFLKINTFPRAHNPFQTLFFLLLFFCKLTPKLSLFPFSAFSSPLLTHSNWPFHPSIPLKVLPLCPIHSLGLCSHLAQPSAALDATGHSLLLEYHLHRDPDAIWGGTAQGFFYVWLPPHCCCPLLWIRNIHLHEANS